MAGRTPSPLDAVETALFAAAAGRTEVPLEITYSDEHGLWGGVTVTLSHEGVFALTARKPGGQPATQQQQLPLSAVIEVARLLVTLEAWSQQVPEPATWIPDESMATLTIRCAGSVVSIWEPYKDLARLGRLVRVRDLLLRFAPDGE